VKEVSIYGYPVKTSQMAANLPDQDQSSIYIKDLHKATGPLKKASACKLSYNLPTEAGISGGPIFTQFAGEHIVIAIHKASTYPETFNIKRDLGKEFENFGVNAEQMLEEVNEWGFEIRKKPFVFTERTLELRKKNIPEMEIFYLCNCAINSADKKLDFQDIQVITAYDLSNLKNIILSKS
jgi:hypothetical protein